MHNPGSPALAIRVFVSSTFRDMRPDREELVKHIFPQLRQACERRGVTWTEVDLRWGITEEQAKRGEVLELCLAEIDRSRPFFLGLLGERYGWVPDALPASLVEREPWLVGAAGRSVTELEVLHGALNRPEAAPRAFFYFRSPEYIDALPPEERSAYQEAPSAEENRCKLVDLKQRIRASGLPVREGYRTPRELGEQVLSDFQALIGQLYPENDVPDPLEREAAEHETFARGRAGLYLARPEYLDRLRQHMQGDGLPLVVVGEAGAGKSALLAHWALACQDKATPPAPPHSRADLIFAAIGVVVWLAGMAAGGGLGYQGGAALYGGLGGLAGAAAGVVAGAVLGFLAAVALLWLFSLGSAPATKKGDINLVLMHFVGASRFGGDTPALLRRLLTELQQRFGIAEEIPDRPEELAAAFPEWLRRVAERGRVLLVLDALDQLDDRTDLGWLPREVPANVRVVLSARPGPIRDALTARGWPTLAVEPLLREEREELLSRRLARSGRALDAHRISRTVSAPACGNPLYLRTLLEELRVHAEHATLDPLLDNYLAAATPNGLFGRVLARYEQDYERDRPGLVREAFALLWAARRGLTEAELLDLLGTDGAPLPHAFWSPLYLAAESAVSRDGSRVGFSHEALSQAVRDRYLPEEEHRRAAHLRLADYFEKRLRAGDLAEGSSGQAVLAYLKGRERATGREADPVSRRLAERHARVYDLGARVVDELPWQLAEAGAWQRLFDLLAGARFCANAMNLDGDAVAGYWVRLEDHFPRGLLDAYGPLLDSPAGPPEYLLNIASLLQARGRPREGLKLLEHIVGQYRQAGDLDCLWFCLRQQARVLLHLGEPDRAHQLQLESEAVGRQLGYVAPADNLAVGDVLRLRGDPGGALKRYRQEEQDGLRLGNRARVQAALGNQALAYREMGQLDRALEALSRQEELCRASGDRGSLQICLGNRAAVLRMGGDPAGAWKVLEEKERMCVQLGNRRGQAGVWGEQALIRHEAGDRAGALVLYRKEEEAYRDLGDRDELRRNLGNQVGLLLESNELEAALPLLQEEAWLAEGLNNRVGLAKSLGNQALVLKARGEHVRALGLLEEQEQICRDASHPMGLALALANQAAVLCEGFGRLDEALRRAEEAHRLAVQHGLAGVAKETQRLRDQIRAAAR